MKTGKYHILFSWILLICFVAGEYMVYAHQHPVSAKTSKPYRAYSDRQGVPHNSFKEWCELCDVMHHNVMVASYQVYLNPVCVIGHVFKTCTYSFTSTRLVHAGGRAPPYCNS